MTARVSLLVPSLCRGGMTRAYVLAGALGSIGVDSEIVGPLAAGASVYPEPPAGVAVRAIPDGPIGRRVDRARRAAAGDTLYAIKPRASSFGLALLIRGGRPVLVDVDDWDVVVDRPRHAGEIAWPRRIARHARRSLTRWSNPDHPAFSRWMERLVPRATAVTANTRFLADRFGATYVPSGKDVARFDPARFDADACRRALGLDGKRVIMFPGTVRSHKGVEDVVTALDALAWPDARLVLVGGREAGDELAGELVRRHPDRVVRLGRFTTDEMPSVVAAAHVVVVPQRDTLAARAQFPMKLTDAMAMAKPIITTPVGDIAGALQGAAFFVPPSSPHALATALTEVFGNPDEAARRGREARARCVAQFSLEAIGRILAGVLASVSRRAAGA